MANVHPAVLRIIREEGLDLFVNSVMHLRLARELLFPGEQMMFSASALSTATMREVYESGAAVTLDSTGQVQQWKRLFPHSGFGIRCNIGSLVEPRNTRGGYFIGKESRLGLLPEEMLSLAGDPGVRGLHLYAGTDICDIEYFRRCYESLAAFAPLFPELEFLDFGGGFGLGDGDEHRFEIGTYGEMVLRVMEQANARMRRTLRLVIEPGRSIGAAAGRFVCRVIDVKHRSGRQLIGVNASSAQFPRPLFYPDTAHHPLTLLHQYQGPNGMADVPSAVYGCSTYSRDFLAQDVVLPPARPGDILVFGNAGAYCAAMHTQFLGFPRPKEVFYDAEACSGTGGAEAVPCATARHL
jgi:diaminopimelate decarboxylase